MAGLRQCFEGQAELANDEPRLWLAIQSVWREYQRRLVAFAEDAPERVSLSIHQHYLGGALYIPHIR